MNTTLPIDVSQTKEKFLSYSTEVMEFLVPNLLKLHELEQEVYERSQKLKNPAEPNQVQPGEQELWAEFEQRHGELIATFSTTANMPGGTSFGKPTKYEYLTKPDTKFTFIMKSAKKAIVETQQAANGSLKEQFVLKRHEKSWKVTAKNYGFKNDTSWYSDDL